MYPRLFHDLSAIGWVVIANVYGQRIVFFRGREERPFHYFDIMTIAMVCYYLGLKHRRIVGRMVLRYWFVFLFVAGILWPPGTHERIEENTVHDWQLRARFNFLEGMFTVFFLVAGDRMVDVRVFSEDGMQWLNNLALVLFLVHKACHIVFPEPYNWLSLILFAPLCWGLSKRRASAVRRKKSQLEQACH